MKARVTLAAVLLAAGTARLAGAASPAAPASNDAAEPDVKVVVTAPSGALAPGARGETKVLLSPPSGVHINRYPMVKLKLEAPATIRLDAAELKQGSATPIENPEDFPFKVIEPLTVGFSVAPDAPAGATRVTGKLSFVYCIARSGYCQRTSRDVGFDVTVAPARTN